MNRTNCAEYASLCPYVMCAYTKEANRNQLTTRTPSEIVSVDISCRNDNDGEAIIEAGRCDLLVQLRRQRLRIENVVFIMDPSTAPNTRFMVPAKTGGASGTLLLNVLEVAT